VAKMLTMPANEAEQNTDFIDDAETTDPSVPDIDDDRGVSADLVRAYLNGIGRTKLLTAVQEVDLARRIEAGLFAEEKLLDSAADLDPQYRADLHTVAAQGKAAKNHLLEAN